jgi:hypothetical protein
VRHGRLVEMVAGRVVFIWLKKKPLSIEEAIFIIQH